MTTEQQQLKAYMENILKSEPTSLRGAVAAEALEHDDIRCFLNDLLQHGCQSGIVNTLVYYNDTRQFYDAHYEEIETLRSALEEEFGTPLCIQGDLKTWFAWLAFEETARVIAQELWLNI